MAAIIICSDFGAQKIKSAIVYTVSWSICHEVTGPDAILLNLILFSQENEKYYMGLSERLFRPPVEAIARIFLFLTIESLPFTACVCSDSWLQETEIKIKLAK